MMRNFLIVGFVLLSIEASPASSIQENPQAILNRAVAQMVTCPVTPKIFKLDSEHKQGTELPPEKNDEAVTAMMTPAFLFREGRFALEYLGHVTLEGHEWQVVNFTPLPEAKQLKPLRGESQNHTKGVNNLSGSAYLDPPTGNFWRIEARLARELSFKWKRIFPYSVNEATLTVSQEEDRGQWWPKLVTLDSNGYSLIKSLNKHTLRVFEFDCTH